MKWNEIVVVVCSAFQKPGSLADKNGIENVFLTVVAGKIPNQAIVVSGTVAEKAGLTIGSTKLVMVNERDEDPVYGRQFSHTVLGDVAPSEILGLRRELGNPVVVDTTGTEGNPEGAAGAGSAAKPQLNTNTSGLPDGSEEDEEAKAERLLAEAKAAKKAKAAAKAGA